MRVSRYETKDTNELYCTFHLSEQELGVLGQPEYIKLKLMAGHFFIHSCGPQADGAIRLNQLHNGERRFQVFAPVFPGTKTFGLEEVASTAHLVNPDGPPQSGNAAYLEALFPEMTTPVKQMVRGSRREKIRVKVDAASKLTDADLVRALNARIRANPMWSVRINSDRTITVAVEGVIA